jgi:hypothetical protein
MLEWGILFNNLREGKMANACGAFHKTTPICLDDTVSYYKEISIDNNFGCPVYMLDSSDNFTELASTAGSTMTVGSVSNRVGDPKQYTLVISIATRRFGECDEHGNAKSMMDSTGRSVTKLILKRSDFETESGCKPIYVPEIAAVLSLQYDYAVMKNTRPTSADDGAMNRLILEVNLHKTEISTVYFTCYGRVLEVKAKHDLSQEEGISIRFKPSGGIPMVLKDKIDKNADISCITTLFADNKIVYGTDREAVTKAYQQLSTANFKKVDDLTRENANLKETLAALEAENKILSRKLNAILNEKKEIHETENMRMKTMSAQADAAANMWKNLATIITAISGIILLIIKITEKTAIKEAEKVLHFAAMPTHSWSIGVMEVIFIIACLCTIYAYRNEIKRMATSIVDCTKNVIKRVVDCTCACVRSVKKTVSKVANHAIDGCKWVGRAASSAFGKVLGWIF